MYTTTNIWEGHRIDSVESLLHMVLIQERVDSERRRGTDEDDRSVALRRRSEEPLETDAPANATDVTRAALRLSPASELRRLQVRGGSGRLNDVI